MDADDLRRMLADRTPVSNEVGNVRVEILRCTGRRNRVVWVPLQEAATLLTRYRDKAALLTLDNPEESTCGTQERS